MTATTRKGLGIATLATIAVITLAFAGVHAQNAGGGQGPAMRGGRGGPQGGPGGAGRGVGRFGGPGGPMGPLGLNRLDLSDAQRDQVRSLVESRRDETKGLADRARSAHDALQAAVTADTFDEGAIRAHSAEVASVEADMAVARARLHADILQILTAEQRTQLKALQAQMKERGDRRGPPSGR